MDASLDQTTASKGPPAWLTPRRLDRAEQVTIVLLWALLAHRVYEASNPFAPLVMLAETSVVIFVLLRRPTEKISMRLGDWLLAGHAQRRDAMADADIDRVEALAHRIDPRGGLLFAAAVVAADQVQRCAGAGDHAQCGRSVAEAGGAGGGVWGVMLSQRRDFAPLFQWGQGELNLAWRTRSRRPSKYVALTGAVGAELAPVRSCSRHCSRSWSLRINSRTYSLLVP